MQRATIVWYDVAEALRTGVQPVYLLKRPLAYEGGLARERGYVSEVARAGHYYVPRSPLVGEAVQWSLTKSGDLVRIPLFAYRTSRALSALLGTGIELGMLAIESLYRAGPSICVDGVTLVLGTECTDLGEAENAFRCYVGVAAMVNSGGGHV